MDTKFGCKVAMEVLQVHPSDVSKNMACSPLSISAAVCVLVAGSEGPSLEQLLRVLEYNTVEEVSDAATRLARLVINNKHQISYVYALWVAHPFILNNNFKQLLRDVYKTHSTTFNLLKVDEFVNEANLWAEKQSNGFIKQIISRDCITKYTTLILANSLCFEGVWAETFEPKYTRDKGFYLLDGTKVRVPFMKKRDTWLYYGMIEGCKIIQMPYKGGNGENTLSMYIFLPEEINGLPSFMQSLNLDANLFDNQIQFKEVWITKLQIPKFDFEYSVSLPDIMKNLGLTHVFNEYCRDLIKMVNSPDYIYVSEIHHKCCVEINEEGTKVAAVTRVDLRLCGCAIEDSSSINFVADHPFMFLIREDFSGNVLFIGTVLDPLSN